MKDRVDFDARSAWRLRFEPAIWRWQIWTSTRRTIVHPDTLSMCG